MTTSETTETQRDLRADLALCSKVLCVYYDDSGGWCADGPEDYGQEFLAEVVHGWPRAIERAIRAEEIAEMWRNEAATQAQQYLDAEEKLEQLRAGIAVAMTYSGGIIVEMLRKLLTEVPADE